MIIKSQCGEFYFRLCDVFEIQLETESTRATKARLIGKISLVFHTVHGRQYYVEMDASGADNDMEELRKHWIRTLGNG